MTSSMHISSTAASSVGNAMLEVERSFLRHVIPLRVQGAGSMATLYRHAFIHQEHLIHRLLRALETVPLPALPRMLLAEGFQRMLEGQTPQRDIRALFEEAENEARRVLIQAEFHSDNCQHQEEGYLYTAIKRDPLMRLLAYELRAACGYYAQLMAISSQPEEGAAALLRTLIASDVRTDPLLVDVMLRFEALHRNEETGERLESCDSPVEEFVKECLLLERDAFGVFRFDARGDNRHLVHCIKLGDIGKTPRSFAVTIDPILQQHGNFILERTPVHQGRWVEHRLSCAPESHRVDSRLPSLETLSVTLNSTETTTTTTSSTHNSNNNNNNSTISGEEPLSLLVRYDEPLCRRHKETTREKDAAIHHIEVFELAARDTSRGFWEKWFLDR
ncbi:uncharacterized protein TM35_000012550 [Trypanosoma theileri]|uniref:Uncharacterized protein n=1 Tax=Trypanosoma theileri TaxID=67003 RepID=A0A1X0P922_9TRYP|nr:uncharacterized protein TM35_000012550 [Trypanosoma theileri]ORC93378.1 hypothetical protein TM35_000012550 [Trypanosoma theileri]